MKFYSLFVFLVSTSLFISCGSMKNDPLKAVLQTQSGIIHQVMQNAKEHEIQIIYTEIKRGKDKSVYFKDYSYNLDANYYHYPASTVKFPIAVMALEKLSTIPNASVNSVFQIGDDTKKWRFSEEISKVFAVSENEASNHLFEFIGFEYLNEGMKQKGIQPFLITHRLSVPNAANTTVDKTILFKDDGTQIEYPSTTIQGYKPLEIKGLFKGIGYMKDDNSIVKTPFDFSKKNDYPIESLHNTLKRVIFPEAFAENQRFKLSEKNREFLLYSMQNLPRNAGYDPKEYYDGYCKFLMYGDTKNPIPDHIKIYNKVGDAYGTLTDCAYIVDTKNNIEFMVTATILVNKNQIFNDGVYEYETVGFPFLAELGRQLYEKNINKKK